MRTIILTTILMVITTFYSSAQYNGRCGDFKYTFTGKLISAVEANDIIVKTYY